MCHGHDMIMLLDMLIKTSFLEDNLHMYIEVYNLTYFDPAISLLSMHSKRINRYVDRD